MGPFVYIDDAKKLLKLLQDMDSGYEPTIEECQWLNQIDNVGFNDLGLYELPESIGRIPNLRELNLNRNRLTKLPKVIQHLTNLERLYIGGNPLKGLPDWLSNCFQIRELTIWNIGLSELPIWLQRLSNLETLNLGWNPLKELPDWLGDFSNLKTLYLVGLNLRSFPSWLQRVTNLNKLWIGANPFQELPDWLGDFRHLQSLQLDSLSLTELPESLLRLQIPFFRNTKAYVDNHFKGILLEDTELSIQPVSIFDQSRDKSPNRQESRRLIEEYFACPKVPIREAKVIFLGEGKVGKTYTIQRLLHNCKNGGYLTEETHGILIEEFHPVKDGETYTVRVWDFGGQDIMHETHRCFLTDRTCYVVMVDTRKNQQTAEARRWLRTIQNIAPKAPVRLLVNQINGSQNLNLDYRALKKEFENLVGVEYCSSLTASDEEFRAKVEQPILEEALRLDSCKMYLPASWEKVRQSLLNMKNTVDENGKPNYYIDRQIFHRLCDENGVPADEGLRTWLLTWFNDLGVCFSYHLEDGRERATDYKILDPMWLTSAVYKIIWGKKQNDDGLIDLSEIYTILKVPGSERLKRDGIPCIAGVTYNKRECGYVLDIMRMFRISYQADKDKEFMPTLCKADSKLEPIPENPIQHAAYKFEYSFLPESVVHRLMIYCYQNLRPGKRWRKGFWLECGALGLSAVIRTVGNDENELQIDVYAQKEAFKAWMWLQLITKEIYRINQLLKLSTTDYLLAENEEEAKWFKRETVWKRRSKGKTLQGDETDFDIEELMVLFYGEYYRSEEQKLLDKSKEKRALITNENLPQKMTVSLAELTQVNLNQPLESQLERFIQAIDRHTAALEKYAAVTQENTDATQGNTAAIQENTRIQKKANEILKAVRDGQATFSDELLSALAEELRKSNDPKLESTGQKMKGKSWKEKGQLLRDLLGDAANLATVAPVLAQLWTSYGPELTAMAKTLAEGARMLISSIPIG